MINYEKYKPMSFTLEKVEDTVFTNEHPNGINTGFTIKNAIINLELSKQYNCLFVYEGSDRWFHTSEINSVKECVGYDLIYTKNSIYKITPNFISITGVQEKYSLTLEMDKEE